MNTPSFFAASSSVWTPGPDGLNWGTGPGTGAVAHPADCWRARSPVGAL